MYHGQWGHKGLLRQGALLAFLVAMAAAVPVIGCAGCGSNGALTVDAVSSSGGAGGSGGLAGGSGRAGAGAATGGDTGTDKDAATPDATADAPVLDQFGYAVVGANVNPPLLHRVKALACQPRTGSQCTTDADCGPGSACACGTFAANLCVPAECLTDGDCSSRLCLFSRGPDEHCCGSGSTRGLYCERPQSTCRDGADCPGNGAACVFITNASRFECRVTSCSDC